MLLLLCKSKAYNKVLQLRRNMSVSKIIVISIVSALLMLSSCAPQLKRFYDGQYYIEDSIYENKSLQFIITYKRGWYLFTQEYEMDNATKAFAHSLHKRNQELLYAGATSDGLYGSRCIAANFNFSVEQFANNIRNANKNDVQKEYGLTNTVIGEYPAYKWVYDQKGFRFVEYFFKINTCDIRIAFWTKTELYANNIDVFEDIISTISQSGPIL
jgi:hypothetical protein